MNIAAIFLLLTVSQVGAADMPQGVNCALVRQYVAEHGKAKALAWALREGFSWHQIAVAKRCLK